MNEDNESTNNSVAIRGDAEEIQKAVEQRKEAHEGRDDQRQRSPFCPVRIEEAIARDEGRRDQRHDCRNTDVEECRSEEYWNLKLCTKKWTFMSLLHCHNLSELPQLEIAPCSAVEDEETGKADAHKSQSRKLKHREGVERTEKCNLMPTALYRRPSSSIPSFFSISEMSVAMMKAATVVSPVRKTPKRRKQAMSVLRDIITSRYSEWHTCNSLDRGKVYQGIVQK